MEELKQFAIKNPDEFFFGCFAFLAFTAIIIIGRAVFNEVKENED